MAISKVLAGSLTGKAVLVTVIVLFRSTLTGTPLLARTPEARDPNAASVEQNRTCGYGIGDVPQSSKLMSTGAIPATRSNTVLLNRAAKSIQRGLEPHTSRCCSLRVMVILTRVKIIVFYS